MTSQDFRKLSALLENIKAGDRDAFSSVYKMYEKKAYFLFCKLVNSKSEAAKLTIELFDYVYLQISNFPDPIDFEKWLYITLFSRAKRHMAQNSPDKAADFADAESPEAEGIEALLAQDSEEMLSYPEGINISVDMMKTADSVLSELPFRLRFAVLGYYFCGFEVADISALEQISVSAVRYRLHKARIRMKTEEHKFTELGYDCVGLVVFLPDIFSSMAQNIVMAADVAAGVTERTGIVCTSADPFASKNRNVGIKPVTNVVTTVSKPSKYAVAPPPVIKKEESMSPAVRIVMAVVAILVIIAATVAVVLIVQGSKDAAPQGSVDNAPDTEQHIAIEITTKETTTASTTAPETTTAETTTEETTTDESTTAETTTDETTTQEPTGETTTTSDVIEEDEPGFNISVG